MQKLLCMQSACPVLRHDKACICKVIIFIQSVVKVESFGISFFANQFIGNDLKNALIPESTAPER